MKDDVEAPAMSGEQAADLAALKNAVIADETPGINANGEPEQEQRPELATEFKALILMAAGALSPAFPSLSEIYTEQTAAAASHAAASVCNKHGWLADGVGGKWAEEIAAAAILLPLAWATYQGVQNDIAKRKKNAPVPEITDQTPGQNTVTFGAPVEQAA